jgi:GNAT superfamily N-acetyltransferase
MGVVACGRGKTGIRQAGHGRAFRPNIGLQPTPACLRSCLGAALTYFALAWMQDAGMSVAMVETGADPGHGPARRTYAKAGFELLPIARYFKKL